ncbi:hypothetical protein E2C01_024322 [Portunus trituberculatus]|uniref:Uncharacterized protein n=1 Tax=Portunus trituberculatus TaxID=210409 RepID=A0A5B7ECV0_PORTR|nr:hypothetical protein [Portunus trituberculatus]
MNEYYALKYSCVVNVADGRFSSLKPERVKSTVFYVRMKPKSQAAEGCGLRDSQVARVKGGIVQIFRHLLKQLPREGGAHP